MSGVDYSLTHICKSSRSWSACKSDNQTIRTPLKREGESLDINSFSVLFSPGGYRHLIFGAIIKYGIDQGFTVRHGLGQDRSKNWGVIAIATRINMDIPVLSNYSPIIRSILS